MNSAIDTTIVQVRGSEGPEVRRCGVGLARQRRLTFRLELHDEGRALAYPFMAGIAGVGHAQEGRQEIVRRGRLNREGNRVEVGQVDVDRVEAVEQRFVEEPRLHQREQWDTRGAEDGPAPV